MNTVDKFNLFIGAAAMWFNYCLNINAIPVIAVFIISIAMIVWFISFNIANFKEYRI